MADLPVGIAIVGMAGRFPGADTVEALWANLRAGVESINTLGESELRAAGVSREPLADPRYVKARGILAGVELFDAEFFGLSPREAELTCPQHRLLLECAWEALESAGYDPARVTSPIGVFAGAGPDGYLRQHILPSGVSADGISGLPVALGNDRDFLATRVAYKLDLRGPSLTVQTACSTSLVAVQLACQSLLSYQCDMALAGGVSVLFPVRQGYLHQPGHILSPDGHCRAFDAAAAGPGSGDGVGAVVLKRLEDAVADRDHIHAIILAAATNNDGAVKAGYSAPGVHGQAEVVALTHAIAGISARTISYIEAHGTGTPLGDPIEIAALTQAFRATTPDRGFCAVGSLKTNLGHLNTAAGVASLIKATLAIEHGEIPPSLHYTAPNPQIDFDRTPFFINSKLRSWPGVDAGVDPRRAGVSSFGIGGTNAHVLLEEPPRQLSEEPARPWQLLVLSARSPAALEAASVRLAQYLERHAPRAEADLADVAYTLQVGRRAFAYRRTILCRDAVEASAALRAGSERALVDPPAERQLFFLFPDQGAEYAGMGRELYAAEAVFRNHIDRAAELLRPHCGYDIRELMFRDTAALGRSELVQPALFAFSYGLARLWLSWGVRPTGFLGQGVGEWVAACLAGVFSFDDALKLVAARGSLMGSLPNEQVTNSVVDAFAAQVARVERCAPELLWISSLTGTFITQAEATDPRYWGRQLRAPERLTQGMSPLRAMPATVLLEVGPASTLPRAQGDGAHVLSSLTAHAGAQQPEVKALLGTLGRLWELHVEVDWAAVHVGEHRRRRPLPTYPFERQRHWIASPAEKQYAPTRALEDVEAELCQTLNIRPLESYPGLVEGLSELCASHVVAFLKAGGADVRAGALHRRDALRRQLSVLPKFHRLFDAMLAMLDADGVTRSEGDEIRFVKSAHALVPPGALQRAIADRYPQFVGLLEFLEHCAASYPGALAGRIEAIAVLYPGGSAELVSRMAQRTAEHRSERIYLSLLNEAVARLRAARPGQKLRILEIGGGQGMLTWPLVSALAKTDPDPELIEYHFTDLGKVFVDDARREAARRGLDHVMTFGLLDLSRDPMQQEGCAGRTFDVVVAYNVIHAVRDVPQALQHLQRVLTPGGTLAMVEAVRVARWDVLTWGLAEGFWYYDDGLRKDSALLPLDSWEEALRAAGFENVAGYPGAARERVQVDHGLVLAQRNGAPAAVAPEQSAARITSARKSRPELRSPYAAPTNELERRLAGLCEELFGIDRVGVHDDFFELGADSLITLRLADMIRVELGRELPAHSAFRGATIASMVQALGEGPDTTELASPLVPIQTAGTRPPFFFVHPVLGVAFGYVGLARALGSDQPFYGLQALGLDGQTTPDLRIEDTASRYIKAIQTVAPVGPYYLGGYSFGCSIAFEMAQQLSRSGEKVALLALVDGPAPVAKNRPTAAGLAKLFSLDVFRTMLPHLHDYLYLAHASKNGGQTTGGGLRGLLARATIANLLPADSRLLTLRQPTALPMFRLLLHHFQQARVYAPPPYGGPITLFKAAESLGPQPRNTDPTLGWSELAAGGLEVHEIAADHFTLLIPPRLSLLADRLSTCLERAQDKKAKEQVWTRLSSTV